MFYSSRSLSDRPKTEISGSVRQVVFVILLLASYLSEKRSNNSYRFFSPLFSLHLLMKNQSRGILKILITIQMHVLDLLTFRTHHRETVTENNPLLDQTVCVSLAHVSLQEEQDQAAMVALVQSKWKSVFL